MSVTMGFVLRVDNYPAAVAIPPLQQGSHPVSPAIETPRVIEPSGTARRNQAKNHLLQRTETMISGPSAMLTYSAKGIAHGTNPLEGGRLLDTYA